MAQIDDHLGASTFLEKGWSKISAADYAGAEEAFRASRSGRKNVTVSCRSVEFTPTSPKKSRSEPVPLRPSGNANSWAEEKGPLPVFS